MTQRRRAPYPKHAIRGLAFPKYGRADSQKELVFPNVRCHGNLPMASVRARRLGRETWRNVCSELLRPPAPNVRRGAFGPQDTKWMTCGIWPHGFGETFNSVVPHDQGKSTGGPTAYPACMFAGRAAYNVCVSTLQRIVVGHADKGQKLNSRPAMH